MSCDEAVKRLRVLEEYTELGSGYEIALRDLEIRGTGNILGHQQHGFINAVGFDTYLKLLNEAISRLESEAPEVEIQPTKINLDLPAYLPDDYVPHSKQKLALYRKISRVTDTAELEQIAEELADRFGPLPKETQGLLAKTKLKLFATCLGMEALFISEGYCKLDFGRNFKYRLAPITNALEVIDGEKKILSLEPLSIIIRPLGKNKALEQITAALAAMSRESEKYLDKTCSGKNTESQEKKYL